jgi:hypothetical protein
MLRRTLLAVAAVAAVTMLGVPAGALGASSERTVYFKNLNSNTVEPPMLWFAANNGPRMADIHWYGWGTRRAVGYGAWMARFPGSEGSEEELDVRPARVILTDRKICDGSSGEPAVPHGARFYTGFELITWDGRYKKHVQRYHGC